MCVVVSECNREIVVVVGSTGERCDAIAVLCDNESARGLNQAWLDYQIGNYLCTNCCTRLVIGLPTTTWGELFFFHKIKLQVQI